MCTESIVRLYTRVLYRKKADSGGKMNYKNVKIAEGARIAKQSVILGNVTIGRDSCVLYYAVIRGDDAPVVIG